MLAKHLGLDKICTISGRIVGASIARPPKIFDFRIILGQYPDFSPYGDGFCLGKIRGRVITLPYRAHRRNVRPRETFFPDTHTFLIDNSKFE